MYLRPSTLEEAVGALARTQGRILAGGTDVLPALVDRVSTAPLIDLSRVQALRGISYGEDMIRIGAGTTWTDVIRADLPRSFQALQLAAREVGSCQIQNVATVVGNLCNASPAADGVPPLLVLDAQLELASVRGRRVLPLSDFIRGNRRTARQNDEIVSAILVPRRAEAARSSFLKLGSRRYLVISIAMAAALVDTDDHGRIRDARIAVGACSAVAQRLTTLERDLVGEPADPRAVAIVNARHLIELSPISDVRATATYRQDAAATVVRRVLAACLAEAAYG